MKRHPQTLLLAVCGLCFAVGIMDVIQGDSSKAAENFTLGFLFFILGASPQRSTKSPNRNR